MMKGFLTQEDILQFHEQGYILKRSCFDPNEIEHLVQQAIQDSIAYIQQTSQKSEDEQMVFYKGSRLVYKYNNTVSLARINGVLGVQPLLEQTARSDKLLHTFFELLGTNDLEHIICQVHPKLPGDGVAYARHRDLQFRKLFDPEWSDILGNGSYAICIMPIDPMNKENGGLWVDKNNFKSEGPEELVWLEALPGDMLFMHPNLYHGSGPNESKTNGRRTLLTGFCAYGANHKAYPGAGVSVRVTLTDKISLQASPWQQDSVLTGSKMH